VLRCALHVAMPRNFRVATSKLISAAPAPTHPQQHFQKRQVQTIVSEVHISLQTCKISIGGKYRKYGSETMTVYFSNLFEFF
jgi:hypothetical protein